MIAFQLGSGEVFSISVEYDDEDDDDDLCDDLVADATDNDDEDDEWQDIEITETTAGNMHQHQPMCPHHSNMVRATLRIVYA